MVDLVDYQACTPDALEQALDTLAAHGNAVHAELLRAVAAADERGDYQADGMCSMADWLAYRYRLHPRTARQWVRAAHALGEMPRLAEQYAAGRVSFDQLGFLNAFPDSTFTIDDMIAEGDQVVTKKTLRGTHTGPLGDISATGQPVTLQYVDIMRVRDGRIVEHWLSMDQLSFMQQLGLIPPQG